MKVSPGICACALSAILLFPSARAACAQDALPGQPSNILPPAAVYDKAIFGRPIASAELAFLKQFVSYTADDAVNDKQFRRLLKNVVPNCTFHYGHDMPLDEALDAALIGSKTPVTLRDGRYIMIAGNQGQYLAGRGFLWFDLQEGIGLGGFFFHPNNGEPTPTIVVFSRQVRERQLTMGQLPPAFETDLIGWATKEDISQVTTRYFITGLNERILLEHDEDFCNPAIEGLMPMGSDCEQMDSDAADVDEVAAYYLDQVDYRTNATAWMIGADQRDFITVRERTCDSLADPLGCHIRFTREHTLVILSRRYPVRR